MTLYKFESGKIRENDVDTSPLIEISSSELHDRDPLTAGVFTTILVREKVPVFMEEHLQRLFKNSEEIGMQMDSKTRHSLEEIIKKSIAKSDDREYGIRPVLWNLYENEAFNIKTDFILYPFNLYFTDKWYYDGITTSLTGWPREQAHIKSLTFTPSLSAEKEAKKRGAQEAIIIDNEGRVYESARSNVSWVYDGAIETPKIGILEGVTISKILEICEKEEIKVSEGTYKDERILNADEVFITGTTKRVMPVVKIDSTTIGAGKPGELTKFLMSEYNGLVENYISEHRTQ